MCCFVHLTDGLLQGNAHFLVPRSRRQSFVGHEEPLHLLTQKLLPYVDRDLPHRHTIVVLWGIGGVGKSEVALQFAEYYRQKYVPENELCSARLTELPASGPCSGSIVLM
jgi:hypothetical protein